VNLWRWADRVLLETVVPPVLEKESLLTSTYVAIFKAPPFEVPFLCLIVPTILVIERSIVKNRVISSLLVVALLVSLIVGVVGCGAGTASPLPPQQRLRVATTTSLYDTGLWGYLEPMFEEQYNVELDIMYAGTGKALEYGRRGDVDVITVHSRAREEQFIAEGYGVARVPFAYNYFLIVGPETDPADIKGMSPEEAFRRLLDTGSASFVSRGDDSGTHGKEKAIWAAAGYD